MSDETITIRGWVWTETFGSTCEFQATFAADEWNHWSDNQRVDEMRNAAIENNDVHFAYEYECEDD